MTSGIIVDAHELVNLGRQMEAAQAVVAQEAAIAMERSAILVQNAAKQTIQQQHIVDTGHLLNSITYGRPVRPFESQIGTNLRYGKPVEEGRAAGAPLPPQDVLLPWMSRHGIPAIFEFVIRRAISRRGIKARPYLHPALESSRPAIDKEFLAAALRVAQKVTRRAA